MAKFCGNCGARMEDSAKVCGNCGTPFDSGSREKDVRINNLEKKEERQRKVKKFIRSCIVLITLIVVTVVAIRLISAYTGANGLLRKTMAAYEEYDIDTLISLSSDIYYYESEEYVEGYFETVAGSMLDSFESSVGHSYKLSYKITEMYTLPNRNFQYVLSGLAQTYSELDVSIIEKIAVAHITLTARQGNRSVDKELKITMSKEDGLWKVLYIA